MPSKKMTRFFRTLLIAAFVVPCISSAVFAATYYVDSVTGNDSNSGLSTTSPWKTISKVNASKFAAGDSILFANGRVWRERLTVSSSGTDGNPITFGAYGTGTKPEINGSDLVAGTWTLYAGTTYSIALSVQPKRVWWGTTDLTLNTSGYQNLSANQFNYTSGRLYVNIGKNPSGEVIEATQRDNCIILNKNYVTIDGLRIVKSNQSNINQSASPSSYCTIQNCVIEKSARQGIYSGQDATNKASYWVVQNCQFLGNGRDTTKDHGIYAKWGMNWTIQNNRFSKNAAFGINLNGSSYCTVRYNYSEGHVTAGFLEFYEDTAGGSKYNKLYYNVSNGDRKLVYMGGGSSHAGSEIFNNTVYNFVHSGLNLESGSLASVKNNIFWSTVSGSKVYSVASGASIQASSNNNVGAGTILYKGTSYANLAALKKAVPSLEVNSISSNPLFESPGSDFHLTASSPCLQAGVNVSLTQDIEGNTIKLGIAPNIGAYESKTVSIYPPTNLRLL